MKSTRPFSNRPLDRRSFLAKAIGAAGVSTAGYLNLVAADVPTVRDPTGAKFLKEVEENERVARRQGRQADDWHWRQT